MARAAKPAKTKDTKARVRPTLTLNPARLTEDEADYLVCLQRKHEKRVPLEEVMRKAGLRVGG